MRVHIARVLAAPLWFGCAAGAGAVGEQGGSVRLLCSVPEAAVAVDGVPVGVCSEFQDRTPLKLAGGLHRLEVTMQGFGPYVTYYSPSGVRATLEVKLSPRSTGVKP